MRCAGMDRFRVVLQGGQGFQFLQGLCPGRLVLSLFMALVVFIQRRIITPMEILKHLVRNFSYFLLYVERYLV